MVVDRQTGTSVMDRWMDPTHQKGSLSKPDRNNFERRIVAPIFNFNSKNLLVVSANKSVYSWTLGPVPELWYGMTDLRDRLVDFQRDQDTRGKDLLRWTGSGIAQQDNGAVVILLIAWSMPK